MTHELPSRTEWSTYRELGLSRPEDLCLIINKDGTIQQATPSFEWLLGCKPTDILGKHLNNLFQEEEYAFVQMLLQDSETDMLIIPILQAQQTHFVEWTTDAHIDGRHTRLVGRDKTDDIEKTRALQFLLYQLTHDIGNDIQRMIGPMDNLVNMLEKAGLMKGDIEKNVQRLGKGVKRARRHIESAYLLTSVQSGRFIQQEIDPEFIIAIKDSVTDIYDDSDVKIRIKRMKKAHPILGDRAQVHTIFLNLITNAIKYSDKARTMQGDSYVEVSVDERTPDENGQLYQIYTVADNGVGIPVEKQPLVFRLGQRFHQDHAKGNGYGLYLVREAVQQMGGDISFESIEGQGTTFFVKLPVKGK